MKARAIVSSALLAFIGVSVVYLAVTEYRGRHNAETDVASAPTPAVGSDADHKVIAYYFHGNKRCQTCRTIEAYAEGAIHISFPNELATGRLEWRVVNVDEAENEHFVRDYELSTRVIVLVDIRDGAEQRFERLEEVWQLVGDKEAFVEYIQDKTDEFLRGSDA